MQPTIQHRTEVALLATVSVDFHKNPIRSPDHTDTLSHPQRHPFRRRRRIAGHIGVFDFSSQMSVLWGLSLVVIGGLAALIWAPFLIWTAFTLLAGT